MRYFLNDRAIIRKWTNVAGTSRQRIRSTATVDCSLQQREDYNTEGETGSFVRDYVIYIDPDDLDVTLSEGDQIEVDGQVYTVNSIERLHLGALDHYQVHCEKTS